MSNRISNTFLVIICLTFLSACKKSFLDQRPYDTVSLDDAIRTEGDMQAAVNGIYSQLRTSTLYGRDILLRPDVMADNVYISATNSNRFLEYFQLNYTVSTVSSANTWINAYRAILRANNVINSAVPSNANTNQLKGEALTLRALMYHELVKTYSKSYTQGGASTFGVPIVTIYDPNLFPPRNTVDEVYTQIEKDLTDAIGLLTARSPYTAAFASKDAAKAILARVYQFKGDWAKANAMALDVINNGGFSLTTTANHVTYWQNSTPRTDKTESILEIGFDPNGNAGLESLPYFFLQSGYGDALAANSLFNIFSATDVRRSLMTDAVRGGVSVKVVNKYPNNINYNTKVIRLSEVYLIAAEAYYHQSNIPQALNYLNLIATKRDPSFTGYTSSGTQVLDDILLERRKELAFEGHRYWDHARYNLDVLRVNVNNNYPGNVPLNFAASNFRRILPIAQNELDANPNIRSQQNPGY